MENFSRNTNRNRERMNGDKYFILFSTTLSFPLFGFLILSSLWLSYVSLFLTSWALLTFVMFGIHGHSLRLPATPIKGHASFELWQPCSDNQAAEWGDLAAEFFFFPCHPISQCSLSVQFDTHRQTSLLASPVQLWAVSPTDLHFPGFSFPSLSFFSSKQHPVLPHWWPSDTYFWALLRLWTILLLLRGERMLPRTPACSQLEQRRVLHEISCFFIWKTTSGDIWLAIHVLLAPMCFPFEVFL